MGKLFSLEEFEEKNIDDLEVLISNTESSFNEEMEELSDSIELASESLKSSSETIILVTDMMTQLNSDKISKDKYLVAVEHFTPIIKTIASNLGVKYSIPSLEDFRNDYSYTSTKEIAMEGLFDYIKKLWKKIKDIFITFFKKVKLFLKKLFNKNKVNKAEVEKALNELNEALTVKNPEILIKETSSPIFKDIDTKLPSMLTFPGLPSITTDYIITNGTTILNNTLNIVNEVNIKETSKLEQITLKKIYEDIKYITSLNLLDVSNEDKIKNTVQSIKSTAILGLNSLFKYEINDIKNLPKGVYNEAQQVFTKEELYGDIKIYSLLDDRNITGNLTLPNDFNIYIIFSSDYKFIVTKYKFYNKGVENKLPPVNDAEVIRNLLKETIRITESFNNDKSVNNYESFQKQLVKIIDLMGSTFTDKMEALRVKHKESISNIGDPLLIKINELMYYLNSILYAGGTKEILDNFDKFHPIAKMLENRFSNYDLESVFHYLVSSDRSQVDEGINILYKTFKDNPQEFISVVDTLIGNANENSNDNIEEIIAILNDLSKFLLNYISGLKGILVNMNLPLTSLFYEFIDALLKFFLDSKSEIEQLNKN